MSKTKKEKTDKKIFIKWILAFLVGVVGGFFSRPVLEWLKTATSGIEFNMEFLMYLATQCFHVRSAILEKNRKTMQEKDNDSCVI